MANIAFGVITNNIDTFYPYCDFLLNAQMNGHTISKLFICYSHKINEKKVERMSEFVDLELLKINENTSLKEKLLEVGLTEIEVSKLIESDKLNNYGLVPYGKRRNIVLTAALLSAPPIDYLIFFDTDVKPYILIDSAGKKDKIDYVGRHLNYLKQDNVVVTTSDYTGYYIIPSMDFNYLEELLKGLQKEKTYDFVKSSDQNLITSKLNNKLKVKHTNKILGGNHALDLNKYRYLAPYYSTTYHYRQNLILSRGEDTLLGQVIPDLGGEIVDINTKIFHNTFDNFPEVPDINNADIKNRFYYACLGWLGRNPFLNWYLKESGKISEEKYQKDIKDQRKDLVMGSYAFAKEYNSPKFKDLPEAYSVAQTQLKHMINEYNELMEVWDKFISKLDQKEVRL